MSAPEQGGLSEARSGDVAYYESCVEGGDPYRVTVVWRHRDPAGQGWYNVAGVLHPIDVTGRELHLLVRDGHPVAARLAAVPAAEAELRAAVEGLADLSAAATPGPWEVWDNVHGDPHIVEHGRGPLTGGIALANTRDDYGRSNAAFIVAAVNLVRSLLAGRGDV